MFIGTDADRARMPVALLTGFLGSGKTTLVNALLRDPRLAETAVAVNEFGAVPLDHQLIETGGDRAVLLANGCLCCNFSGDVEQAVMRIFTRRQDGGLPRFSRLLIELSGLADPAPIAQAILRNPVLSRVLRLEAILCTVDAVFGARQLAEQPEARLQAGLADRFVITKPDLTDTDRLASLASLLQDINPLVACHQVPHGVIDVADILPAGWIDPGSPATAPARYGLFAADAPAGGGAHGVPAVAVCLTEPQALDWRRFDLWLRDIRLGFADQLLRIKAILHVARAARPLVIQGVHHVLHPPVELPDWPDADRGSRIVMLTRGLPAGTIEARWQAALPGLLAAPV